MTIKPSDSDLNTVPNAILDRLSKAFGPQLVALGAIGTAARSATRFSMTDLDIYIVLDEGNGTSSTAWAELKDATKRKIRQLLADLTLETYHVENLDFHIYLLPEFYKRLWHHDPFILVLIREGTPVFDRGLVKPLKGLLAAGELLPSQEAVRNYLHAGEDLLKNARRKLVDLASDELYYAAVTVAQALLMSTGQFPCAPKEIPFRLKELFKQGEGSRLPFDYSVVAELIAVRERHQGGEPISCSASELDRLLSNLEEFIKCAAGFISSNS